MKEIETQIDFLRLIGSAVDADVANAVLDRAPKNPVKLLRQSIVFWADLKDMQRIDFEVLGLSCILVDLERQTGYSARLISRWAVKLFWEDNDW